MGNQSSTDDSYWHTGTNGIEHLTTLSQQEIASLVRIGLDLDMVLNPYQMERLNDGKDDKKEPEVANSVHVNNSTHLHPRSIFFQEVSPEEAVNGNSFNLLLTYSSTVPFRLALYYFPEETTGNDGCPAFVSKSTSPQLSSPTYVLLSPAMSHTITLPISHEFTDRLLYVLSTTELNIPSHTTPEFRQDVMNLREASQASVFSHLVIALEIVTPVVHPDIDQSTDHTTLSATYGSTSPRNDRHGSLQASAKGYTTAEWNFIKLKHNVGTRNNTSIVTNLQVNTCKRAFAAGKGLFEALDIYGWENSNDNDSNSNFGSGEHAVDVNSTAPDCVICMALASELAILPCRHLCLCIECAKSLTDRAENSQQIKCPMCREKISAFIDIRT